MTLTDNETRAVCRAIDEERARVIRATCAPRETWWDRNSAYVVIGGWFALVAVLANIRAIARFVEAW